MSTWQELLKNRSIASLDALRERFGAAHVQEIDRGACDLVQHLLQIGAVEALVEPDGEGLQALQATQAQWGESLEHMCSATQGTGRPRPCILPRTWTVGRSGQPAAREPVPALRDRRVDPTRNAQRAFMPLCRRRRDSLS